MKSKYIYIALFTLVLFILVVMGCGNYSNPIEYKDKNLSKEIVDNNEKNTSLLILKDDNLSLELNNYIDKIFSNVDLSEGIQQYHFESILIFSNLYSSMYDTNVSNKFNNFLYVDFRKRKKKIYEDLKKDKNRLSSLQFLYLYSQNLKNNLQHNDSLNQNILNEYHEEYIFLVNRIILPFWYDYPAWHWTKKYLNMENRIIAKIEKKDSKLLQYSYYTAFIDEDGFSCAINADLLYINRLFSNDLAIDLNTSQLTKLKHIRDKCTEYIKQKTILEKDNFHFATGDWSDHPDYAYADCNSTIYPEETCIDKTIEPDVSHFNRFPWWIKSMKDAYVLNSNDNLYFTTWLNQFSVHFEKNILVKKDNIYLLTNFINGKNSWYRVNYHTEYEKFGFGEYELSLASGLGSYYTLVGYNSNMCDYVESSNILFESDKSKYIHYFDEKYETSYTKFLKDMSIYKDRFKNYSLNAKLALKIWCK